MMLRRFLFLCLLVAVPALAQPVHFTTGDRLETSLLMDSLVASEHTLMLRFRLDYPAAYWGWFVAASQSGEYLVGQADYDAAGKRTLLHVNLAGQAFNLPDQGELQAHRWYHLALVVTRSRVEVYLDGRSVKVVPLQLPDTAWATGRLQLGQRVGVPRLEQFYGQLKDVAVWKGALEPAAIALAASGNRLPRLPVWQLQTSARPVSSQVTVPLRFPLQGIWRAIQGFSNGPGSHVGYAAFCYDLVNSTGQTAGAEILAAAGGTVVKRVDGHPDGPGPCNEIVLQHAPNFFTSYLHLQSGSLQVQMGQRVRAGQPLARVGSTGTNSPHLHFAVLYQTPNPADNLADLTCPFRFSNTEIRGPAGTWQAGQPRAGWEVRHR